MLIRTYSYKKDKNRLLSDNFTVGEFVSHDVVSNPAGADTIKIDLDLVDALQEIRDNINSPLTITSGYRTTAHNLAVGGASNSYHLKGQAADVKSNKVPSFIIAWEAKQCGLLNGIECRFYGKSSDYCHLDTRGRAWNAVAGEKAGYTTVPSLFGTLRKGDSGELVAFLQRILCWFGFTVDADGIFGEQTENTIKGIQKLMSLKPDGIVGTKTWEALCDIATQNL